MHNAMNCDDFRKLTIFRQVELLFDKGQHVLSRIYLFYNVHLYSLSGFYAEIWYRQADNKIERVIILDQADVLDLYDKQIGLGEITGFISPKE